MKKLLLLGILICLLSSMVVADCTTTEDIKRCIQTVDLDTETFTDTSVIVIFHDVDFTISRTEPNASNIYDGDSINVSMTAASFIFEDTSIDFSATDASTPAGEGEGGAGGEVTFTLNAGAGTIGFYNSEFNLTAGDGADGGSGSGEYESDGGAGGNMTISFTASQIYMNETSVFRFMAGSGGGGKAGAAGLGSKAEALGGDAGELNFGVSSEFESNGDIYLTAGDAGLGAAQVGQNEESAVNGVTGGLILFTGESISLENFTFTSGSGSSGVAYVNGLDTSDSGSGGASGTITINSTDTLSFIGVGSFNFGTSGDGDTACWGSGAEAGWGGNSGDLDLYFNHSIINGSAITFTAGDGGDGDACGDDTADGGRGGDFLFSGTNADFVNSNFTLNAGSPGAESGSEGSDGDMSDFIIQTSLSLDNSTIKTIQDTTTYYCNRGGSLWIIGDYFNISSSTVVMNASTSGGDDEGSTSDCNSGGGGDLIVRVNTSLFEDGSLTLTSGPGGRGTGGATEIDANSGPLTFNISEFTMDNFTLNLGTGDVTVVEGGSNVGDMKVNFDNITWNNVTFNWDEGDPTDATISIVNITEIAIIDNNSLINFTTNNATVSTADYWYFWGWKTRIFDTQLTNTSNTGLNYTVKTEGWDFQDEHNYMFLDNLTCSGGVLVANNTVSSIVHNRTQSMTACTVTWEGGITEENETEAEWYTRIFNVTPRGNGSLDWPNDGWNCYTDFEVYNSSVVNATSDNFTGTHSVGDTIWCSLNLSLAADFDFARNKSTTTVAPYPYNWSLYVGDQNATWTPVPLTGVNVTLATNDTAVQTAVVGFVFMKNISGSAEDWAANNSINGIDVDLDVSKFNIRWRENDAPHGGICQCKVLYSYTNGVQQNTSSQTTTVGSLGVFDETSFANPNVSLEVDYTELWCGETNPTAAQERCEITNSNLTGNWSYKPDWYDTELNGSVISYYRGGINYWEQYECTDTTCYVPINFTSNSSDSLWNLSNLSVEWGQSSAAHGDYQVPIVITVNRSGMFNLSNWIFEYYNDTEIEMNVTTNTSINRIINITHSKINFSQAYDYIEFYPTTLSSKNVTPWGQNSSVPFFNITYDANRDFEIAILLNESMPSCMNISGSKDNNSQYHVLTTSEYALTNMTVNDSLSVWLNLDLEKCNRTALHALYTVDAYFDTCCDGCVPCFD